MRYQIIDMQTGAVVGTYATVLRARRRADQLDSEHGAIRYAVRPVELGMSSKPTHRATVLP